jgi:hypothetical protein
MHGVVTAVSRSATHTLTKPAHGSIRLLTGLLLDFVKGHAGNGAGHAERGPSLRNTIRSMSPGAWPISVSIAAASER